MRTVAFKTFGCRLNQAETAAFEQAFAEAGIRRVRFGEPADVVVVHSCVVTQVAEDECLRQLRALRRKLPAARVVLSGCAAEAVPHDRLLAAGADLVIDRSQREVLVQRILKQWPATPEVSERQSTVVLAPSRRSKRALLKVQDGCDFFCTYCIVPHTRGRAASRPLARCVGEAQALVAAGYREIVVTGCNIACYADGSYGLIDLLAELAALPGLGRLRLGSIEPGTIEDAVAEWMAGSEKLCKFLHLPIQSGDDGVLTRMGRHYTVRQVINTVRRAQQRMPDVALGADLICGFPGESPDAFERTLRMVADLGFSNLHVFPYSERPGTPACTYDGQVPVVERRQRAKRLIAQGEAQRVAFAQRFAGRRVEVLVERFDREGRACGWSGEYLPCVVTGVPRDHLGELCRFTVESVDGASLAGRADL
ncbi:MAG TPA: MiaB/RimO family radical SAM methylthiotransferase [Kiritimatiellia bacterium]|nr:MiaB/RimO family radical SAM methylthiotransferase [Kiritimatiellia bacterium]HRU71553.1 MiaB/RimO family radical SAM methylthiotransferase [Kiritimatiellia bacterium]